MQDSLNLTNLTRRAKSKTPKFWKKVQKIALITGAIAGGILTFPISLPAAVVTVATVAASVAGTALAVAQLTEDRGDIKSNNDNNESK
jgi:hypothetical protein